MYYRPIQYSVYNKINNSCLSTGVYNTMEHAYNDAPGKVDSVLL